MKFKDVLELNSNTVAKNIEKIKKETEEWVWVEGYKGTESNMKCRDQQYELGKTYVMPEGSDVEVCKSGFHFCLGLVDVFSYYRIGNGRRYFKVKALVRKSDLDKQYDPTAYLDKHRSLDYFFTMTSVTCNNTTGTIQFTTNNDDKLAAKSIEFIRELTIDEIFENTYAKDWSEEYKKIAIEQGIEHADYLIEEQKRKVEQQKKENTLVELGYSRSFAALIIKDGKYDRAYAVGSQTDLSMDMKVFAILKS